MAPLIGPPSYTGTGPNRPPIARTITLRGLATALSASSPITKQTIPALWPRLAWFIEGSYLQRLRNNAPNILSGVYLNRQQIKSKLKTYRFLPLDFLHSHISLLSEQSKYHKVSSLTKNLKILTEYSKSTVLGKAYQRRQNKSVSQRLTRFLSPKSWRSCWVLVRRINTQGLEVRCPTNGMNCKRFSVSGAWWEVVRVSPIVCRQWAGAEQYSS